jgi:dienelactone hydrolase
VRFLSALLLCAAVARAQDLAALVDAAPGARATAAREMARRDGVELAALLEAMRAFTPRDGGKTRTGSWTETVTLRNGTEAHVALYVPRGYDPAHPAALLLALHGAGGAGENMIGWWRPVADELGMIVVAPTEAGPEAGYGFTERERDDALAALRWARRRFQVDENRVHLTGISRGGHMTWDLGTRHPDLFATLSPMIGGPYLEPSGGRNTLRYVENIAHLPVRDLQGEQDHPLLLFNLRLAFRRLEEFGAKDAKLLTFPELGHAFEFEAVDWKAFLGPARRDPRRRRVVRTCADPKREGRAAWIEILATKRDVKEAFRVRVGAEWNTMSNAEKRVTLARAADRRTARLEVRMEQPGRFVAKSSGVRRFRLLLADGMFVPGERVTVVWNGRTRRKSAEPSKEVVLLDFAERFDRTYLPVVEVRIP